MSMTLILWKEPVVREAEEAEAMLKPYYDHQDDSGFEPSTAIAAFADDLRALYPWRDLTNEETVAQMSEDERAKWKPEALKEIRGVDGGEPFATLPFDQTERIILVDIKWGADDGVVEDIMRLAEEHGLLLYDPQGPEVYPADSWHTEPAPGPPPKLTTGMLLKSVLMVVPFVAATYGAWLIPWGWLRWPLVAIGLFFTAAALFAFWAVVASTSDKGDGAESA